MYKFSIGLHLNFGMSVIHGHVLTIAYLQFFWCSIYFLSLHSSLTCKLSFKGGIAIVLVVILVGFGCREMKCSCRDLTIMELKQLKHRMLWHCNSPCCDTSWFWMSWNETFIWWFDHHGVKYLAKHGVLTIIPVPKSGFISLALMVWWYQLVLIQVWVVSIMCDFN